MQTKAEIIARLKDIQRGSVASVQAMTPAQFEQGQGDLWAASGYLKHLILSVKPVAKAIQMMPEQIGKLFGAAENPSRTYDEVVAMYKQRISEGIRAEDYGAVTPTQYRFPEGTTDQQAYLVATWDEANNRLFTALEGWSEADLDTHQIPHPAIGLLTVREMLFFTIYHNNLHWQDIEQAGVAVG